MAKKLSETLKFDDKGLIPAVIQDADDGTILMVAYMNKESFELTLKNKKACFYSRSRQKLWLKGESSGNVQKVKEIYVDCDADCVLVKVKQIGDAACHTGFRTCFYRKVESNSLKTKGKPVFDPEKVYKKSK
ncbi:MAG: phosphoribosyl-AMP cyclohydrolase [Elusimicrobia bacterium RIFOXYA2_FULL_39_19]|nr:MAG: phosphoribosyl-AMP cyclohydrolase [Elusimicrobia bacterium RIFOXYA2_FULL_39_19]